MTAGAGVGAQAPGRAGPRRGSGGGGACHRAAAADEFAQEPAAALPQAGRAQRPRGRCRGRAGPLRGSAAGGRRGVRRHVGPQQVPDAGSSPRAPCGANLRTRASTRTIAAAALEQLSDEDEEAAARELVERKLRGCRRRSKTGRADKITRRLAVHAGPQGIPALARLPDRCGCPRPCRGPCRSSSRIRSRNLAEPRSAAGTCPGEGRSRRGLRAHRTDPLPLTGESDHFLPSIRHHPSTDAPASTRNRHRRPPAPTRCAPSAAR